MAEKDAVADREAAEEEVRKAGIALAEASQRAAEAGAGLAAATMRNVPDMEVQVMPGCHVSHNDKSYYGEGYSLAPEDHKGNDKLVLEGPTALALAAQNQVEILGTVKSKTKKESA